MKKALFLVVMSMLMVSANAKAEFVWGGEAESGKASFTDRIMRKRLVEIGIIPEGKTNVRIDMRAFRGRDIDLQLFDPTTGEKIIGRPDGIINAAQAKDTEYNSMHIAYSGHKGIDDNKGHEFIEISGTVTVDLVVKAFSSRRGGALFINQWGLGTGQACGSRGLEPCKEGLFCKNGADGNNEVDIPGTCHTQSWCENDETAAEDCATMGRPPLGSEWTCEDSVCRASTIPGGQKCQTDQDCDPRLMCKKKRGECNSTGFCNFVFQPSCPAPQEWMELGKLCTCEGRTVTDYCSPESHMNIDYEGPCVVDN